MIIICEPQCTGFEHVEFNSALIALFRITFPDKQVQFIAEEGHLSLVQTKLKLYSIDGIKFNPITIANNSLPSFKKLVVDNKLCEWIFNLARENQTNEVVFSSTSSTHLIAVKNILRRYQEIKCIVVPHHILETIIIRPSFRKPFELPFWFRFSFLYRNTKNLKYLLLGPSIERELTRLFPKVKKYVSSIHHPYFYNDAKDYLPFSDNIVRFGSFGVGHRSKGTDQFIKMALEINRQKTFLKPECILIGHLVDEALKNSPKGSVVIPSPDKPLERNLFDDLANRIDYAVYFYKPTQYRLTASGALFDAFSFLKPIIALRNPFFEYYFDTMGDIGYLCDSYEEMKNKIIEILNKKPTEKYLSQRKNLLAGRQKLELSKIGRQLYKIWNDL